MISVVMSTYKRPDKLIVAIESVIAQTYTDWELIIVHDGPVDWGPKPADNRIRWFNLPENFGNDTRPKNRGILASQGELIAFLDDDNTWRPHHLAVLKAELDRHREIDLVYGDRWVIDDAGGQPSSLGIAADFEPGRLLERNYIDTSDILVRRQALFDVGGFDERHRKYCDWNLWLRLEKDGKVLRRVPRILSDYHSHNSNRSQTYLTRNERAFRKIYQDWIPLPDWRIIPERELQHGPYDFGAWALEIELPYLGEIHRPRLAVFSNAHKGLVYRLGLWIRRHDVYLIISALKTLQRKHPD